MVSSEHTKPLVGGKRDRKKLLKGTIYTWAPSVLFTTLRRLSGKSLAVKVPMLKAPPITYIRKRCISAQCLKISYLHEKGPRRNCNL